MALVLFTWKESVANPGSGRPSYSGGETNSRRFTRDLRRIDRSARAFRNGKGGETWEATKIKEVLLN